MRPIVVKFPIVLTALTWSALATAEDAKIGAATIVIPVPHGLCPIDRSHPADEALYQTINSLLAGRTKLVAFFAECAQLKDWRVRKRPLLDDFVQVQTPLASMSSDVPIPGIEATKQICAMSRAEGEKLDPGLVKDVGARIEAVLKNVKQNEARSMGVLGEEPNACYAALVQKLTTQAGTEKTQLSVFSTSVLKGKIIYHYRFGPYEGQSSVERLLDEEKKHVKALLAANSQ